MSRTYRDIYLGHYNRLDLRYGNWYDLCHMKIPKKYKIKYQHFTWYSILPKAWNKCYHIRPKRRYGKYYIKQILNNNYNVIEPINNTSRPTEYYY